MGTHWTSLKEFCFRAEKEPEIYSDPFGRPVIIEIIELLLPWHSLSKKVSNYENIPQFKGGLKNNRTRFKKRIIVWTCI